MTNGSNEGTYETNQPGSIGEVVLLPPTIALIVLEGPEWTKHCSGAI